MEVVVFDPLWWLDWEGTRLVLDDSLGELDESHREIILMRFFERRDPTEVSAKLNTCGNTVRMITQSALASLRASLARRGIVLSTPTIEVMLTNKAVTVAPTGLAESVVRVVLASEGLAPNSFL